MAADPKQMLCDMLRLLGIEGQVEQLGSDEGLLLHIESPEGGRLIGRQGMTLANLQFLLNRMVHKADQTAPHVIVDVCRYRERQHDLLIRQVQEQGDRVRRWGEPVTLPALSPYERRVIHRYYADDPDIETISESGDETSHKRVMLRLRQRPM